ncbi:MAG TPA: hypothetical protein VGE67_20115 [Haloferula sp.]
MLRQLAKIQRTPSSPGIAPNPPSSTASKSRQREARDLSPEALCERISKASGHGDKDAIFKAIRRDLSQLNPSEIIAMLDRLTTSNAGTKTDLEILLLDTLATKEPSLVADQLLARFQSEDGDSWESFSASFFDQWIGSDDSAAMAWLDARDNLRANDSAARRMVVIGETAALTHLLQKAPTAALDRVHSLPTDIAAPAINATFRQQSSLLAPDQAIEFLRGGLGGQNHEALVGLVCGTQLYSQSPETLREFFRKHDAALPEREAIIREAVKMKVGMGGYGGDTDKFLAESRKLAEEEGPGALDHITAVILGETSDRDHQDQKAVDLLLSFNPNNEALRTFLEIRGSSLEKSQRLRIEERLSLP